MSVLRIGTCASRPLTHESLLDLRVAGVRAYAALTSSSPGPCCRSGPVSAQGSRRCGGGCVPRAARQAAGLPAAYQHRYWRPCWPFQFPALHTCHSGFVRVCSSVLTSIHLRLPPSVCFLIVPQHFSFRMAATLFEPDNANGVRVLRSLPPVRLYSSFAHGTC